MNLKDYKTLPRGFYSENALIIAKKLLGKYFVRKIGKQVLIGKVVETEAYLPFDDPAAHSYIGKTQRNKILFGAAGFSYVYSIHKYHCINISADEDGVAGCVLIRALEPIEGLDLMKKNRNRQGQYELMSGPGKICQAMLINRAQNGIDITIKSSEIFILDNPNEIIKDQDIVKTTRIGISKAKDLPFRFYLKDNKFISKK